MSLVTNLQNYYKLDESSGNAADTVGSLTLTNTSVTYGSGLINNAAIFNGSAGLQSGSNIGITGTSARSINFWFKNNSSSGDGLVCFGTTGTGQGFSALMSSGNLYFGGESADVASGLSINDGNWHMCTITYDGTTLRTYVDGTAGATGAPTLNTTNAHLYVGSRNDASSKITGSIDEVGVWTRELTSGEITSLYNSGAGFAYPFTVSTSTLRLRSLLGVGI